MILSSLRLAACEESRRSGTLVVEEDEAEDLLSPRTDFEAGFVEEELSAVARLLEL